MMNESREEQLSNITFIRTFFMIGDLSEKQKILDLNDARKIVSFITN